MKCPYCTKENKSNGWHGCPQSLRAKQRLETVIGDIHLSQLKPNFRPQTNSQMKGRADSLRDMATTVKLQGRRVHGEYL